MSHSLIICSRLLLGGSFISSCLTCLCLSLQGHQEKHGSEEGKGPHGWSDLEDGEQERTSRERGVSLDFYVCREKTQRQEILNLLRGGVHEFLSSEESFIVGINGLTTLMKAWGE
uniref:Uncharacterized protein n=1 Tax=Piliocolobus tephrosceles TaxID=591936 RepID=A0A8C9LKF1_9PRIM